ncbi:YciI family protein [Fluviicola sp.]|uniref:YciI family protein n=1 Tax=Fluviicola sp. TaxID=1917219 RepID=UPI0031E4014F
MDKQQYFLKLNPPRPSFIMDMTEAEKDIMQKHVAYWMELLEKGIAIVFGPVMDPAGGYGAGVVSVDDEAQLKQLIADDPANGLNQYEYHPMRAVFKQ